MKAEIELDELNRLKDIESAYSVFNTAEPRQSAHSVSGSCRLKYDGHYLYATMPDGTTIPGQIALRLQDRINEPIKAIIEIHLDLTELNV